MSTKVSLSKIQANLFPSINGSWLVPHKRIEIKNHWRNSSGEPIQYIDVNVQYALLTNSAGIQKIFSMKNGKANIGNKFSSGGEREDLPWQASIWYHIWMLGTEDGGVRILLTSIASPDSSTNPIPKPDDGNGNNFSDSYTYFGYIGSLYSSSEKSIVPFHQINNKVIIHSGFVGGNPKWGASPTATPPNEYLIKNDDDLAYIGGQLLNHRTNAAGGWEPGGETANTWIDANNTNSKSNAYNGISDWISGEADGAAKNENMWGHIHKNLSNIIPSTAKKIRGSILNENGWTYRSGSAFVGGMLLSPVQDDNICYFHHIQGHSSSPHGHEFELPIFTPQTFYYKIMEDTDEQWVNLFIHQYEY